ncbi:MAG TPA: VOC family protein [Tepidisphaeraceae bacterium]|jgi:predicted 3-demethylubiquinone-9 3-methyltransferase (glyoxalase superfamily)
MQKITPFLWFDGQAEEAMNFYGSIFPGFKVLNISRYGEGSPGPTGKVMTATSVMTSSSGNRLAASRS